MIDLSRYQNKMSDRCFRVLTRAVDESQRRQHFFLGIEHLFLALLEIEHDLFKEMAEDVRLPLDLVDEAVQAQMHTAKQYLGVGMRIPSDTKLVFKHAWEEAQKRGRNLIQSADLLAAMFRDDQSLPARTLMSFGVSPDEVQEWLRSRHRERKSGSELRRRKYDLPPHLAMYGINLNQLALQGRIPPLVGREAEIRQMVEILCHRERQNSVMLVGDAGVGKTALAEGLARQLELEPQTIPERLREAQIVNLQMNTLVAGTVFRGMFEDRMEKIIREVRERKDIILFVDEAHTMIGAGTALGVTSDAATILRSALARGEVQIVGATTLAEYKMHIQEDEALTRRFRVVHVEEPAPEHARLILAEAGKRYEEYYGVNVSDGALNAAMELSRRYMHHLRLPDKAIGWLNTACVKVEFHGEEKIVRAEDVARVVAEEAKIPFAMLARDGIPPFEKLPGVLDGRVVGQREAKEAVIRRLRLNKGPLKLDATRPDGVLLFLGPTGVGKTEMAKALAEFLFGDDRKMVRLDMSEYSDSTLGVDKLIGMPRGIVGSERGGVLTSAVRDNPFTIVLLDEMEKANRWVRDLFLQVFDEGWMTDGRGRKVYFSDSTIIMTSNLGAEHFKSLTRPMGFLQEGKEFSAIRADVMAELEKAFSPEFINRIDEVVVFTPLSEGEVRQIVERHLAALDAHLRGFGKSLSYTEEAAAALALKGYSIQYGARFLKRVIDETVKLPVMEQWDRASHFILDLQAGSLVVYGAN